MGVVQGLAPDRVVLLGSVSKSLAPGVRLGWSLCPPDLGAGRRGRERTGPTGARPCSTSSRSRARARSGQYDRHLRRMRVRYAQRRAVLVETLGACSAPSVGLTGMAAGFHVVATLPGRRRAVIEEAVCLGARDSGCTTSTVTAHGPATDRTQLVLGFGNVRTSAIPEAILRVRRSSGLTVAATRGVR